MRNIFAIHSLYLNGHCDSCLEVESQELDIKSSFLKCVAADPSDFINLKMLSGLMKPHQLTVRTANVFGVLQ